ncbi:CC0125/CC1285 family lipoprotein [Phenylobacterium sp.]|uniref:CC0125/CC1285 family lipoprotein n=1 Tax=Phenylobacterium sp. TaxID=1871053 RepID=UPI002FE215DA
MSKRSAALAAVLALAAGLGACATATPYQPNLPGQQTSGGYSEMRLEQNRFRVNFAGNSLTSRETVEGYLLFRAAELTVQNGYDWFSIVDRHTDRNARTYVEPDPFYRPWYGPSYGFWRPSWRYYGRGYGWRTWDPFWGDPFWADRVDVRTVERFEAAAEIVMGRGQKPADDIRAFDARAVIDSLRPRIQYPTPR